MGQPAPDGLRGAAREAGADGEGGLSIMTFIDTVWTKVKTWFTDLFAWGKKAGATEDGGWSLMSFIYGKDGVVNKVKQWFTDLFSFGSIPTVIQLDFFTPRETNSITPPIPPHKRIPWCFPISEPRFSAILITD